jgi:cyclic lactone autoinducer peptide
MKKMYLFLAGVAAIAATISTVFACQTCGYQPKMRE